jgi:hypothetical protein
MEYEFYAETSSGYIIKVISEVLHNCLSNEFSMTLKESGIYSSNSDIRSTILISFNLNMEKFDTYKCINKKIILVNLKNFQKLLKSIKKKDSLILFIEKGSQKLGIRIITNVGNKKSDRITTDYLMFREVLTKVNTDETEYHFPKVIPSGDFQKMCKKAISIPTKVMSIKIQTTNYVSFFCDGGDPMSSNTEFGVLDVNEEDIYTNEFYKDTITQLMKIIGLSPKMQILAPKNHNSPVIKIKISAGSLGDVDIVIKSKSLIDYDVEDMNKKK